MTHLIKIGYGLLIPLFLTIGSIVQAQQTQGSPFQQQGVVIEPGERGQWDGRYTDPGAVVYYDGLFHMFRNGFQGWPASVQIGYLTSDDGIHWEEVTEDPVLHTDEVPFADVAALASSVIVRDDGTWMLYFYTWNSTAKWLGNGNIGLATADNPLGPWTVMDEPVLVPSESGAWDDNTVNQPSVVVGEDGEYMMFYSGYGTSGKTSIGMATSADGITWTKYDDPATEGEFAESDPVFFGNDAGWDSGSLHQPRVVQNDDGQLVMVYRQRVLGGGNMRLGVAVSDDGLNWQRYGEGPVFAPADVTESASGFWFTALEYHDGTYYLYVESDGGQPGTRIFVFTYDGTFDTSEN